VTDIATGRSVQFIAYGTPAPQGSKRGFNHPSTGKVILLEQAGAKLKDWRADVRLAAIDAMAADLPLTGPLGIAICFTIPKPKSAPKRARTWPDKRPDLDKLVRATLDALKPVAIVDDSQIVLLEAGKCYPDEGPYALPVTGAEITIWQVTE
jgi:Holliday junction resolvase RusA-like endonuclease